MADIQTYLDYILSKVYGKDVRQAIVDAINQCYVDATAGITPVITTEQIVGGTKFIVTVGSTSTSFDVMNGISPQVAEASTASAMTDTDLIYVYTKDPAEDGYITGYWYFYDDYIQNWRSGGQYQSSVPTIDSTLTITGAAADAKKTGDEIADLRSSIEQASGLTSAIKSALLQLAQKVAYIDEDGQTYYDDLYDALYPPIVVTAITLSANSLSFGTLNSTQQLTATTTPVGGEVIWSSSNPSVATVSATGLVTAVAWGNATITATSGNVSATCSVAIAQATVTSISATYTQSGDVYDSDSLDSLKTDLVVTATWSNQTTSTVASSDYTLSGTLTAGTSTITVSYSGQTTTFNVTVSKSMCIAYSFSNIEWTSGKIDDTGALVSDSSRSTWDEFIPAEYRTGFAIVDSAGTKPNNVYLSEFDANKAFLANQSGAQASFEQNTNAEYVKLSVASSVAVNSYSFLKMEQTSESSALIYSDTYLDSSGNATTTAGTACTDFIDVGAYTNPVFVLQSYSGGIVLCFYDSSQTFISRKATGSGLASGTIPSNAKYFRISCTVGTGKSQLSSFLI